MTEAEVVLVVRMDTLGQLQATNCYTGKGFLPRSTLRRIQAVVSGELAHNPSGNGVLEQRTELLRRLIAANGGHKQGETWADAVDRIIENRRSHGAALDDQQRLTKEALADALAAQRHAERTYHKQGIVEPRSPYDRLVVQRGTGAAMYADVYEILAAFDTGSSALDHLVKKALAPGQRHAKDRAKDLEEIEWSATCARMENEVAKAKWASVAAPIDGISRATIGTPEEPKKECFWAGILHRVGTQRIGDFYVDLPGESCRAWGEGLPAAPQGRVKAEPTEVESLFSAIVADEGFAAATGLTQTEKDAWAEVCCRLSLGRTGYVHKGVGALVVGVGPRRLALNKAREGGTPIVMWGEVVEWIKWRAALETRASE